MISSPEVLRALWQCDPFGITEPALRSQLSEALGGRTIGNGELAEALGRLQTRHWAVQSRNDDQDPVWSLTPDGRTEAAQRFK